MNYGTQIGKKFDECGNPILFQGISVVADIKKNEYLDKVYESLNKFNEGEKSIIIMPKESWHVTITRGVNNQGRIEDTWPKDLPFNSGLDELDAFVENRCKNIEYPNCSIYRPDDIKITQEDVRIHLIPDDIDELISFSENFKNMLSIERDDKSYTYHITLAYTLDWDLAKEKMSKYYNELIEEVNKIKYLETKTPYIGYYNDMIKFSKRREK